jgi:hypothetical protein
MLSRYHLRHLAGLEELSRNESELAVKVVVLRNAEKRNLRSFLPIEV